MPKTKKNPGEAQEKAIAAEATNKSEEVNEEVKKETVVGDTNKDAYAKKHLLNVVTDDDLKDRSEIKYFFTLATVGSDIAASANLAVIDFEVARCLDAVERLFRLGVKMIFTMEHGPTSVSVSYRYSEQEEWKTDTLSGAESILLYHALGVFAERVESFRVMVKIAKSLQSYGIELLSCKRPGLLSDGKGCIKIAQRGMENATVYYCDEYDDYLALRSLGCHLKIREVITRIGASVLEAYGIASLECRESSFVIKFRDYIPSRCASATVSYPHYSVPSLLDAVKDILDACSRQTLHMVDDMVEIFPTLNRNPSTEDVRKMIDSICADHGVNIHGE